MSHPEMNVHVDGTPDVPDIVRPGDWLALTDYNGFESFVLVVKIFKTEEGEWDHCPGAESWSILYLGIGYLKKEENLSRHDCGGINGVVAVDGELLQLYKLGWNEENKRRVVPNPGYEVTRSAESLIKRMNAAEHSVHPTSGSLRLYRHFPTFEIIHILKFYLPRPLAGNVSRSAYTWHKKERAKCLTIALLSQSER